MHKKNEIESLIGEHNKKLAANLQVPVLINLIDKLEGMNIHDIEVVKMTEELYYLLRDIVRGEKRKKNKYAKVFRSLTEYVKKQYGLVSKGYYASVYLSIGLTMGTAIGVSLTAAVNTAFLAVGIGIGIALGAGIGSHMDSKAEKEGNVY